MVSKIWEIYENFNELVYVADIDTYQLIYMNKKCRELTGISSLEDIKKYRCYEVLQKSNTPCRMCTNDKIKANCFYEWQYYNPLFNAIYELKDTIIEDGDKRYRMELAFDITKQQRKNETLETMKNNEALVNNALSYALSEQDPEKSIEIIIEYFGKALQGERAYIFEQFDDYCKNTYEWVAAGIVPQKDNLQQLTHTDVEMWYEQFKKNRLVIIVRLEDIKLKDPNMYAVLEPQGIHSLVVAPLINQNKIIGFFGIDNPPKKLIKYIYNVLNLLSKFIVSLITRRDLVRQLEKLSYYDQLTGAKNRHALMYFMQHYDKNSSIGIIYADIMGLKLANDTHGHLAGDQLLNNAYQLLIFYFGKEFVFRVGGDEFLVMSLGQTKEYFDSNVQKLQNDMENKNVYLALGVVWRDKFEHNELDTLIVEADQLMYKEKRNMYAKYPKFDRRKR